MTRSERGATPVFVAAVVRRVLLREGGGEAMHFVVGRGGAHPRFQLADDLEVAHGAHGGSEGVGGHGKPEGDFGGGAGERFAQPAEIGGQHADHGVGGAVQVEDAADGVGRTVQAVLPERVRDHDDWFGLSAAVLIGCEGPAEQRADAEHGKEFGGDEEGVKLAGFGFSGEHHAPDDADGGQG